MSTGGAFLAALFPLAAAGCFDAVPSRSTGLPDAPITPPTLPQPAPTITGPAVLYQRISDSSYGSDAYLLSLGSDSAFVIVFPGGATYGGWSGRYHRADGDSVLLFTYKGSSGSALGTLRGDTLLLKYDDVMWLTDFESGVYVKAGVTP
jgi:hypothetical protein